VRDSDGNRSGPLGLTANIGISGVNRPQHPQDESNDLNRFTRERDEASGR
jgi:hypothetical protein